MKSVRNDTIREKHETSKTSGSHHRTQVSCEGKKHPIPLPQYVIEHFESFIRI